MRRRASLHHTQITNQVDRSTTNRNAASADIRHARHRRGQMSVDGNDNQIILLFIGVIG